MTREEKINDILNALNIMYKIIGFEKNLLDIKILNNIDMDDSEFRSSDNSILFKEPYFNSASLLELVSQAFHEARHFYQYVQINFKDKLKDNNLYIEDINLCDKWEYEFKNYIRPSSNIDTDYKFLDQNIEIDAMAFSYYLTQRLFKIEIYIPKYIEDRFMVRLNLIKSLYD